MFFPHKYAQYFTTKWMIHMKYIIIYIHFLYCSWFFVIYTNHESNNWHTVMVNAVSPDAHTYIYMQMFNVHWFRNKAQVLKTYMDTSSRSGTSKMHPQGTQNCKLGISHEYRSPTKHSFSSSKLVLNSFQRCFLFVWTVSVKLNL